MAVHFKRSGTPWIQPKPVQWAEYYLILGIIVVACTLLLAAGGGTVYYVRVYEVRSARTEVRNGRNRGHRRAGSMGSECELLLPDGWGGDKDR
jgi:hypothetical protein